ncbi:MULTISPECIES: ABC transporter substrate-binding protein [Methanobacterium]|uniref:ABC transporter substrate-binding protein n=1 Tax=Methanobacterium veterum TaxID=408577 RepID=A0A9E5DK02_9EURY|nr:MULTISPECIES: ABC transporter substrate-binding protein [Methanobacterium]MCZ3365099.1 ABC transporter substrate-binding protein [Methanobacterium veterum]MCZ3372854.1 ABC transporter substrate-binding protein [Methanobacterium veterum]
MGYLSTIYHTSFILKNEPLGNLNNYDLKWSLFATGPAMKDAFASGDLDVGYIGLPPVMIGLENGLKVKCVGGGHVEGTVMVAPKYYKTFDELGSVNAVLKQFEGKKIGTPSKGCIHDVIIREITKNLDIEIKNFAWADFIPDAIEEVEIAAGVGTPSIASVASRRFASKVVIPPHKLWPYNPSYGIVVREELIDESPEFITDFLKAHEEACNLIRLHPEQAAEIVLKEVKVVDEDFVLDTYKISPKYCASIPEEYIESTLKFIPVLQRLSYMKGDLNQENIFNLEFIKKIHPEPAHY